MEENGNIDKSGVRAAIIIYWKRTVFRKDNLAINFFIKIK